MTGGTGENGETGLCAETARLAKRAETTLLAERAGTAWQARVRGSDSEFAEVYKIERVNRVI